MLSGRAEYVMPYFTVGPGIGTNVLHKGGDRNDYYRESLPQMFPLEHFPKGVIPIYLPLSMLFPTLMVWRKAYCDCLTTSVVKQSQPTFHQAMYLLYKDGHYLLFIDGLIGSM